MKILAIIQAITAVLLMITILMQNRGNGLGAAFGGDGGGSYHTKRGIEKFLFTASATLGGFFIIISILTIMTQ